MQSFNHDNSYIGQGTWQVPQYYAKFCLAIILSCLQVPLLCRLLTMTIPIVSWNVASSSVLSQFFLTLYFVMSTSSFTIQTFNHDNSYIVMECGKFLSTMPSFFDNIFLSCLQVPLMQSFNHDNSYSQRNL